MFRFLLVKIKKTSRLLFDFKIAVLFLHKFLATQHYLFTQNFKFENERFYNPTIC